MSVALRCRAKKHGLCGEGEIYYCHFMLQNAYCCLQTMRGDTWSGQFPKILFQLKPLGQNFHLLYHTLVYEVGLGGKDGERRVEDGRRNFSLLPLPNVERPEGAPTRYLDFCRLCRSFSMLQEKFILTQNYLLLSLTLLCISACKSVSLGPICPRVDGHLSENTRTPSHSTSPLATFSLLL